MKRMTITRGGQQLNAEVYATYNPPESGGVSCPRYGESIDVDAIWVGEEEVLDTLTPMEVSDLEQQILTMRHQ